MTEAVRPVNRWVVLLLAGAWRGEDVWGTYTCINNLKNTSKYRWHTFSPLKTKMWRVCEDPFVRLRLWSEAVVPCEQFSRLDSKPGLVPWVTQHFTLQPISNSKLVLGCLTPLVLHPAWKCSPHPPSRQCIKRLLPPVCWQTKHLCGPWTSTVERLAPFWGGL